MSQNRYQRTYVCSNCGSEVEDRDKLTVKKVSFHTMGNPPKGGKTIRSRVIDWLCPDCLIKDDVWTRPAYVDPIEYREQQEAERRAQTRP
jgi:hypothetical protein